jgi:hypothetical protein
VLRVALRVCVRVCVCVCGVSVQHGTTSWSTHHHRDACSRVVLWLYCLHAPTHPACAGDVYRRDSIDATHYPVFHQMEGVRIFSPPDWEGAGLEATPFAERELKASLKVGVCWVCVWVVCLFGLSCCFSRPCASSPHPLSLRHNP